MADRVALYLRVSTSRQAERDLSIPDQRRQGEAYCAAKGWEIVKDYIEPGASATDDKRPSFQRMIDEACSSERPFNVILVHSFSRFFRDAFQLEFYVRKLAKHGVRLASVTQETGDDPTSAMIRQIMALFDEYQSKENAKHTLRAMRENARQGFWNGSRPPLGYRVVEAERRGDKAKKRLEIDPKEAEIVRMIFTLYRVGDGRRGPLGIKAIVNHLNAKGFRQRTGTRFTTKTVHEILRRTTYVGRYYFNQVNSRTRQPKPKDEWVEVAVPPVIEERDYEAVQALLASRNPKKTPPRVVNSPVLLTGLAKCASCGGGMTLRTGKSGKYRYYTCATCARKGKTACKGRSVPMATLDDLIIDQLCQRLFEPERLTELLQKLSARNAESSDKRREELKGLNKGLREVEQRIERLYEAIETGLVKDSDSFRNRLSTLEQQREENLRLIALAKRQISIPQGEMLPRKVKAFSRAIRDKLVSGDVAFRKAYLGLFIDRIEVDDREVRIMGSKAALANALRNPADIQRGAVPSFMADWRTISLPIRKLRVQFFPGAPLFQGLRESCG